jgi:hypothetical protein
VVMNFRRLIYYWKLKVISVEIISLGKVVIDQFVTVFLISTKLLPQLK